MKNKTDTATWDKYRLILSAFFNWCAEEGRQYVKSNILHRRKEFYGEPNRTKEIRYYTEKEIAKLFEYLDSHYPAIKSTFFKTLAYTGLRLSELINLKWSAVNLRRKEISIVGNTKSRRKRYIPVSPNLMSLLKSLPSDNEYVFDNGHNEPMLTGWAWYKILKSALGKCGIKGGNIHTFRHTFASHLVMSGVDLSSVQKLLGHSRIETTSIYSHLSPGHLKSTIEKLPY